MKILTTALYFAAAVLAVYVALMAYNYTLDKLTAPAATPACTVQYFV